MAKYREPKNEKNIYIYNHIHLGKQGSLRHTQKKGFS